MASKIRLLVTGSAGFVAPYVIAAVKAAIREPIEILATAGYSVVHETLGRLETMDITDPQQVYGVIGEFKPTHVMHLAGISALGDAAADPGLAWRVNVFGALNCAKALQKFCPHGTFIFVSSSQVYGSTAMGGWPLRETDLLDPTSEYGVTKAAADLALGAMAHHGLRVIRFRPFNHTGPGQTESFVIPNFASQIARIEARRMPPIIRVGNLEAQRDFLDVRDVADAYVRAILMSDQILPGTILNLASGKPSTIQSILDMLISFSNVPVVLETDRDRWRPNDIPILVGDSSVARKVLGWETKWSTEQTLREVLDFFRQKEAES